MNIIKIMIPKISTVFLHENDTVRQGLERFRAHENIFDNSDFIYMLNQASGDRDILAEKLHISKEQME